MSFRIAVGVAIALVIGLSAIVWQPLQVTGLATGGEVHVMSDGGSSWWNTAWSYKKNITITNNNDTTALANYSIPIDPALYNTTGLVLSAHFSEGDGFVVSDSSRNNNVGTLYGNTALLLHFDENISTTAYDASPYGNNGIINGATWATGKSNTGLSFDGVNDYVDVGTGPRLRPSSTIEWWAKVEPGGGGPMLQEEFWTSGTNLFSLQPEVLASNGALSIWAYSLLGGSRNDFLVNVAGDYRDSQWHHYAIVFSGGTGSFYLDGQYKNQDAFNYVNWDASSFSGLKLGEICGYFSNSCASWPKKYFNGTIDEVAIYNNKSLTAAEIQAHYNAGRAKFTDWTSGGKFGNGMSFDGIDDYTSAPDSPSLQPSTWTIGAWIYPQSDPIGSTDFLVFKEQLGNGGPYDVRRNGDGSIEVLVEQNSGGWRWGSWKTAANAAPINQWTRFDWIWSGNSGSSTDTKLYINGVSVSTTFTQSSYASVVPTYTSQPLLIGKDASNQYYFNGTIDEVRIYNRSLSATEVSELYLATKARLDYGDVRFVGSGELSYWMEGDDRFWVKAPSVGAGSNATIQMYYGNPNASSASNSANTFMAYADFNSDEGFGWVDNDVDEAYRNNAGYIRSNLNRIDYVNFPAYNKNSVTKAYPLNYFPNDFAVEYAIRDSGTGGSSSWFFLGLSNTNFSHSASDPIAAGNATWTQISSGSSGSYPYAQAMSEYIHNGVRTYNASTINFSFNTIYYGRLERVGTTLKSRMFADPSRTIDAPGSPNIIANLVRDNFTYFYPVVGSPAGASGRAMTGWIDDFRVRPFASPEPTVAAGTEEQRIPWWKASWGYRRLINVTNSNATTAMANYAVSVDSQIYNTSGLVLSAHFSEGDGSTMQDYSGNNNRGTYYGNTVLLMHMDENAGTTVYDYSPYGNNGTISGATWTAGKSNSGLNFNGSTDYVWIGSHNGLSAGAITLEAWVKPTVDSTQNIIIQGSNSPTSGDGYYRLEITSANKARTYFGNGATVLNVEGTTVLQTGNWYHLVGLWDGSTVKIFVNGVLENSAAWSGPNAISTGTLIGKYISAGYYFPGTIDEVAIYSKALNASEIAAHYNAGKAKFADWTTGKFGNGMSFDGGTDWIDVGDLPLDAYTDGTVGMWTYADVYQNSSNYLISSTLYSSGYYYFWITAQGNSRACMIYSPTGGSGCSGTDNTAANTSAYASGWHNFVCSWGSGGIKLYMDGDLIASHACTGKVPSYITKTSVGAAAVQSGASAFNGTIDEVRIYNRSLSAAEISDLYNATKAKLDYGDIRFVQNSAELNYWMEQDNKFWVKLPYLPAGSNTTIQMYYGNPSANSTGNSSAVWWTLENTSWTWGRAADMGNGETIFVNFTSVNGNSNNLAFLRRIDASGNVVFNTTPTYSNHYDAAWDSAGGYAVPNFYCTDATYGYSGCTMYLQKWNSTNALVVNKSIRSGNNVFSRGVAVDSGNNIIVAGAGGPNYMWIGKYNSTGDLQCEFSDTAGSGDWWVMFYDVAVDSAGNIIAGGTSDAICPTVGQRCARLDKINSTCGSLWNVNPFNTPYDSIVSSLAVNNESNILTLVESGPTASHNRFDLMFYNSTGSNLWNKTNFDSGNFLGWSRHNLAAAVGKNFLVGGQTLDNKPVFYLVSASDGSILNKWVLYEVPGKSAVSAIKYDKLTNTALVAVENDWERTNHASFRKYKFIELEPTLGAGAEGTGPPQASYTTFGGSTTDFNSVPNIESVSQPVLENTSYGKITWLGAVNASGANFNTNVNISQNLVRVNTSALDPTFNTPANVTIYGLSFPNALPLWDPEDDGTFSVCPPSVCSNVSYSGGNLSFGVTHFTTYSGGGNVTSCGTLLTAGIYVLTQNISYASNSNCMHIGAVNVTLDCQGYMLTCTGSCTIPGLGWAIDDPGSDNPIIKNCKINNSYAGIYLYNGADNGLIVNNTFTGAGVAIELYNTPPTSSNSTIANNTIIGSTSYAIFARDSPNNKVLGNVINNSNYGILMDSALGASTLNQNNTVTGNTIINSTSIDIYTYNSLLTNVFMNNVVSNANTTSNISLGGDNFTLVATKGALPTNQPAYANVSHYVDLVNLTAGSWAFINFSYADGELDGIFESSLAIWKYNGSWVQSGWNGTRVLNTTSNIVGVNITTFGSTFAPLGLVTNLTSCGLIVASGNYILGSNVSSNGTCITVNANDVTLDCKGYTINYSIVSGGYGVYSANFNNLTLENCNIYRPATNVYRPKGVYLKNSNSNTISNVTITSSPTTVENNYGIEFENASYNNVYIASINVSGGSGSNIGIILGSGSNNNSINSSTLNITSGFLATGMYFIYGAFNNTVDLTVISATHRGLSFWENAGNNEARDSNITAAISIYLPRFSADNNRFTNLRVFSTQWDYYSDQVLNITVTNLTTQQNLISFTSKDIALKGVASPPDPPGYSNISYYVNATNNSATSWLFLNFSYSDSDWNTTGITNESTLSVWKYNGSDWIQSGWNGTRVLNTTNNVVGVNITTFGSTFAPLGRTITNITSCDTINNPGSYILGANLSSAGTCITINASNVTLDCQGWTINYSTSTTGYAVLATNNNNITVRNCNIVQGSTTTNSHAIYYSNSSNGLITNNTININSYYGYGVYNSLSSINNTISSNNITSLGQYGYGIALYGTNSYPSYSNNISFNNITTTNTYGRGIYFTFSGENVVSSNKITTSDYYSDGIYVYDGSDGNNITSNSITVNGVYGDGIVLAHIYNTRIISNNITTNSYDGDGLFITLSRNSVISSNNITTNGNYADGIYSEYISDGNQYASNRITTNGNYANGISLYGVQTNTFTNNNVFSATGWDYVSSTYGVYASTGNVYTNLTLVRNNVTISFTDFHTAIKAVNASTAPSDPSGAKNITKYINATANDPGNSWLFLNFSYNTSDLGSINESKLRVAKYTGTNWSWTGFYAASQWGVDTDANVVFANITNFSSIFAPLADEMPPNTTITSPVNLTWQRASFNAAISDTDPSLNASACYWRIVDNGVQSWPTGGVAVSGKPGTWDTRTCSDDVTVTVGASANCSGQGIGKCGIEAFAIDLIGNVG